MFILESPFSPLQWHLWTHLALLQCRAPPCSCTRRKAAWPHWFSQSECLGGKNGRNQTTQPSRLCASPDRDLTPRGLRPGQLCLQPRSLSPLLRTTAGTRRRIQEAVPFLAAVLLMMSLPLSELSRKKFGKWHPLISHSFLWVAQSQWWMMLEDDQYGLQRYLPQIHTPKITVIPQIHTRNYTTVPRSTSHVAPGGSTETACVSRFRSQFKSCLYHLLPGLLETN